MSKTVAVTLAELKRAGYPFNPTRASNWYGGILASLLDKKHRSDRIDLLTERTLKQMDIDTRGNRRTVILKQVEKAIRSLCAKNILNQYTPERVRIQSGVNQTKLDRYLARKPLPWSEEEAAVSLADPISDHDEEGGEAYAAESITSQNDQPDLFSAAPSDEDHPLGSMPVGLPHLPPIVKPVLDTAPSFWRAETADEGEIRSPEANRALSQLLPRGFDLPISEAVTPPHGPSSAPPGIPIGSSSQSTLNALIEAIRERDPSIAVRNQLARQAVLIAGEGCEIEVEWRRTGELRAFLCFPHVALSSVLRHIGATWADLRVAIDPQGRAGVQRMMSAATAPEDLAVMLLADIQTLDDAMSS